MKFNGEENMQSEVIQVGDQHRVIFKDMDAGEVVEIRIFPAGMKEQAIQFAKKIVGVE